ncbi:RSP_7527 family protein [Marinomonas mediterranea]|jgi:hypothetical protein|uniref:Uncharacterized protein n=1 Tax=Marinomonas mediterranea (strain ATCC 700492 / JCM 21426 / NBRC 103028 / MMB-1) TaxID=717774 RepID=F2K2X3_MARM1|nr:hypothetical protein [Marinomonas mediterranea]ADZ92362.1 hypothetical protein Marme_3144 [Marinomonas mediterranea MMB-1]WCN10315.1 hypothetical protein GV055_16020 [Marinomonas mediterranea]WCN14359.1 hypothetical protein GV054_15835 [Marinomonas mediterranea]WCN18411.1 hypothetical protein GV053_15900 [Marinomonas mediterranea MMB-1]
MKTNTVADLIKNIDTSYMTQSELDLAIARAQRAEFIAKSIAASVTWIKSKMTFKANVKVAGHQPA